MSKWPMGLGAKGLPLFASSRHPQFRHFGLDRRTEWSAGIKTCKSSFNSLISIIFVTILSSPAPKKAEF